MPFLKLRDIELYYEQKGHGNPLVLVPGLSGTVDSFGLVASSLSKHFSLIMIDNRGAGRTRGGVSPFSVNQMADDINCLISYLGIQKFSILGHSMGGFIAQEYTINYPERIDKLILSNTALKTSSRNRELFLTLLRVLEEGASWESWHRLFSPWLFTSEFINGKNNYEQMISYCLNYPYHQTIEGFRGQLSACMDYDGTNSLSRIKSPVLTIYGNRDILITPSESIEMGKIIKSNEFKAMGNSAHVPMMESKAVYAEIIIDFLSKG